MFILLLPCAIYLIYRYLSKSLGHWTRMGVKQKNGMEQIFDNWKPILRHRQTVTEMVQYFYNKFPSERYFGMYQFNKPVLFIKDPQLIKQVLVKDCKYFLDHTDSNSEKYEELLWNTFLFALTGQKWKNMRALLSSIFTNSKLKQSFAVMNECTLFLISHFKNMNSDLITIDAREVFGSYSVDVATATTYGIQLKSLDNTEDKVYRTIKEVSYLSGFWISLKFFLFFTLPKLYKFLHLKVLDRKVETFFRKFVENLMEKRRASDITQCDLLSLLMANQENNNNTKRNTEKEPLDKGNGLGSDETISDDDIVAATLGMLISAINPLSNFLHFLIYEIAVNEGVQENLRKEIRSYFEEFEEAISYEQLQEMKYMELVVLECLRKWPTGLVTDRICNAPFTIPPTNENERTVHLDKGSVIWIPIFGLHRDPRYFPDPEKFDPTRFDGKNMQIIPYTYLPFGAGPRNCIGYRYGKMAVKILLYHLLNSFEIVPVANTDIPIKTSKTAFTLAPNGKVWLGLRRLS